MSFIKIAIEGLKKTINFYGSFAHEKKVILSKKIFLIVV